MRRRKECNLAPVGPADNDIPAAPGDDATARLLLALTALYVQRSSHTADEQQQYTELALRLVDKAGRDTRAAVAARLHRHRDAPAAVIERLGGTQFWRDGGSDGGQPRPAQDQNDVADQHFESDSRLALAGQEPLAREARSAPMLRQPVPAPAAGQLVRLTPEFGNAFFAASPVERRRMLSEIAAGDAGEAPGNGRPFHVRIDIAPWQSRTGAFASDFERLIDAPTSLCERILNDPSGEPMVIAARATGMPVAVLQRILLLVSPAAHHPVQRVYELTDLYYGLDGRTARALLAVWRSAARPDDKQTPAPVTKLRARFGALNARIQG
jgi:hypothetical protein